MLEMHPQQRFPDAISNDFVLNPIRSCWAHPPRLRASAVKIIF